MELQSRTALCGTAHVPNYHLPDGAEKDEEPLGVQPPLANQVDIGQR